MQLVWGVLVLAFVALAFMAHFTPEDCGRDTSFIMGCLAVVAFCSLLSACGGTDEPIAEEVPTVQIPTPVHPASGAR